MSRNVARVAVTAAIVLSLAGCDVFDLYTMLDGRPPTDDGGGGVVPLSLSVVEVSLYAAGTYAFSAQGGVPPYVYSVEAGAGTIGATTGIYTAPAGAGTDTVRVTDFLGATIDATVTVLEAIRFDIWPSSVTLNVGSAMVFDTTGGMAPVVYEVVSGGGVVDAQTGLYTAPVASGTEVVRATDAAGSTATATVTVEDNTVFTISPAAITLNVNGTLDFGAYGGVDPVVYEVVFPGAGVVDPDTGFYTAPPTPGEEIVRATDALGSHSDATVTLESNLDFSISPVSITLYVNNTMTFITLGGVAPYTFEITSGAGTVNASTGLYRAPGSPGTDTVTVTDAALSTDTATILVLLPFSFTPGALRLSVNGTHTFGATGGLAPYTFSVIGGSGTIDPDTGDYTAPAAADQDVVLVEDTVGNTAVCAVVVDAVPPLAISPATYALNVDENVIFGATGGQAPYVFSLFGGTGSVNAGTGEYQAPGAPDAGVVVRVTDSATPIPGTADATVVAVNGGPVAIHPAVLNVGQGDEVQFAASGGTPDYTYSKVSGSGTVQSNQGTYRASNSGVGIAVVRVTDGSTTSDATVTLVPGTPTDLTVDGAAGGAQDIQLTWTDRATGEDGFSIERRDGVGAFAQIATVGPDLTTFSQGGLTVNTVYVYRIRAYVGALYSAYSNEDFAVPNR